MSSFDRFRYSNEFGPGDKVRRLVWELVYAFAFRPTPRWTLHWWRTSLLKLFGASIGVGCRIAPSCRIWAPWNLVMGDYSALGDAVDCYSMDKISIGSKVAVSQRSFLCAGSHRIDTLNRPLVTGPIVIGDHVWIAAQVFVHPNVTISDGAVVGACSVVYKDVPEWVVCTGNPCKVIRRRNLRE